MEIKPLVGGPFATKPMAAATKFKGEPSKDMGDPSNNKIIKTVSWMVGTTISILGTAYLVEHYYAHQKDLDALAIKIESVYKELGEKIDNKDRSVHYQLDMMNRSELQGKVLQYELTPDVKHSTSERTLYLQNKQAIEDINQKWANRPHN